MTLAPDRHICNGKYHILRLLGEGGMARIWLAEEPRFGDRRVAIKEPRSGLLPDMMQEVQARYQREVQVCAALEQAGVPHIVRAITAEVHEDTLLLVMEYMAGGDLSAMLAQHPEGLPLERAVAIALELLQALEGVHDHPLEIVHRDIKPGNVLFDDQGRAHLADFGLAQMAGTSGRSQLQGGQHPGTPLYMAPEQAASPQPLLPAADLYAVGCVLFEMVTGQRYKRHRPGTRAGDQRPGVPGWLDDTLARSLAEDPWDRYRSATEMAADLEAGAEGERARQEEQTRQARLAQEKARRQAEEEARQARLAALDREARRLIVQDLAAAWAALEQIRGEDPKYPGLAELDAELSRTVKADRRIDNREARAPMLREHGAGKKVLAGLLGLVLAVLVILILAGGLWASKPWWEPILFPLEPTATPRAGSTPEQEVVDVFVRERDGMEMVYVPAGEFLMGSKDSDPDADDDEMPQHTVYLDAFWIDRTEVTNAQYEACVAADACDASRYADDSRFNSPRQPVVGVDWGDAAAYCQWAAARLPTEAEWEKAARGTDGQRYPWGNTDADCDKANYSGCVGRTAQGGSYPSGASPYRALDMAGNVWEWVSDWYNPDYYDSSPPSNPEGPDSAVYRVLRGGSWYYVSRLLRSAYRIRWDPVSLYFDIGFRCGMSSTSSP